MATLRGQLRVWIAALLVFPAAPLAVLLPLDCCAAHRSASKTIAEESESGPREGHRCHKEAGPTHCPMAAADGTACPMHRQQADSERCVMRAGCTAPADVLAALLGQHGVIGDPIAFAFAVHSRPAPASPSSHLICRRTPPETPPPRA